MLNLEIDGRTGAGASGQHGDGRREPLGIYVPHFCYHKKLSIAANCRMCLVQVEKAPKPLPACATPAAEGMKVWTASRAGGAGAEIGDGVPADQPPARLPDLRPGRRVPAAGSRGRLRPVGLALHRGEARRLPQEPGPARGGRGDDALHPVHALRALRAGDRRRDGARDDRARRARGDRLVRRPHRRFGAVGQHDRHLSGRRAHVEAVPLRRADVGARATQVGVAARFARQQSHRPGEGRPRAARRCRSRTRRSTSAGSRTRIASRTKRSEATSASRADDQGRRRMEDRRLADGARSRRRRACAIRWSKHGGAALGTLVSPHSTLEEMALAAKLTRGARLGQYRLPPPPDRISAATAMGRASRGSACRSPSSTRSIACSSSAASCARIIRLLAQRLRQAAKKGAQISLLHSVADDSLITRRAFVRRAAVDAAAGARRDRGRGGARARASQCRPRWRASSRRQPQR